MTSHARPGCRVSECECQVPMLPGEEALNGGSLTLCREEKQLNLHSAAGLFGAARPSERSPGRGRGRFAENVRAHASDYKEQRRGRIGRRFSASAPAWSAARSVSEFLTTWKTASASRS